MVADNAQWAKGLSAPCQSPGDAHACNCIGPQNGVPLCPCMMRGVEIVNGRYVRVQDLGPAPQPQAPYRPRDAVARPTAPISPTQKAMLAKVTSEWRPIFDVGAANCTNLTLSNLENRGLIELRIDPTEKRYSKWQVRLAPQAAA